MTAIDANKVAEARRLEKEGKSQRQIAAALRKPRHWVRYSLAAAVAKEPSAASVIDVPLHLIRANPHARAVDRVHVDALAGSIVEIDLLEPVVVRSLGDAYEVMAGLHRVEAFRSLGRETIPAIIREANDLIAELALIDENLIRRDLSPAERAMAMQRRKVIYLDLHPETAHGGDRRSSGELGHLKEDSEVNRFTQATAETTKISERTIRRDAARGANLGGDVLKKVVGTSLDKGEELDALAKLSEPKRHEMISRAVAGEVVTAKTAVKGEVRAAREAELAKKIAAGNLALAHKRYGVILADPEWRYEAYSKVTGLDRAPENYYPTSETAVIAARPVQDIAAKDCVLFLWATQAMLPDALHVMASWGFTYINQSISRCTFMRRI